VRWARGRRAEHRITSNANGNAPPTPRRDELHEAQPHVLCFALAASRSALQYDQILVPVLDERHLRLLMGFEHDSATGLGLPVRKSYRTTWGCCQD